MVSLYIAGVEVVLPSDFATEIKIENSFFTKNGEYTYEFKLPLNNPTNAALYSHLHRLNNASEIKEKRQGMTLHRMRMTKAYAMHLELKRTGTINP